jgi:hypothetical protein
MKNTDKNSLSQEKKREIFNFSSLHDTKSPYLVKILEYLVARSHLPSMYFSHSYIAAYFKCNRVTILRNLKILRALGFLDWENFSTKVQRSLKEGKPNEYWINPALFEKDNLKQYKAFLCSFYAITLAVLFSNSVPVVPVTPLSYIKGFKNVLLASISVGNVMPSEQPPPFGKISIKKQQGEERRSTYNDEDYGALRAEWGSKALEPYDRQPWFNRVFAMQMKQRQEQWALLRAKNYCDCLKCKQKKFGPRCALPKEKASPPAAPRPPVMSRELWLQSQAQMPSQEKGPKSMSSLLQNL